MNLPKWAGRTLSVSVYTLRVYWFRCLSLLCLSGIALLLWPPAPPATAVIPTVFVASPIPATPLADRQLRARRVSLSLDDILLEEALDRLRLAGQVNILISDLAAEAMRDEAMRVRLSLSEARLDDALALMLFAREDALTAKFEDRLIIISAADEGLPPLATRVYDIRDLEISADEAAEALGSALDPELGAHGFIDGERGRLIARLSLRGHRSLAAIIDGLRRGGALTFPADEPAVEISPRAHQALRHRLRSRRFQRLELRRPLLAAADALAAAGELPVLLSPGLDPEAYQTRLILDDISLERSLDLLVRQHGLEWRIVRGAVVLMSSEEAFARQRFVLDLIPVGELLGDGLDQQELVELVINAVGDERWELPASIDAVGACLLVRQTPEVHARIRELLAGLRD